MTFSTRAVLMFAVATFVSAPALRAGQFNIHVAGSDTTDCSAIQVSSEESEVAAAEEAVTVGTGPLRVTAPRNGGIWVNGSDNPTFTVRACKFTSAGRDVDAQAKLAAIRVQSQGNHVSATGPDSERWVVFFIVDAPHGSDVTAESTNGPISIREFDGMLAMHAKNGPIAIKNSRGTINADSVNGPISIASSSGDVHVSAENGPLAVTLDGEAWNGPGLQGRTQNGPISLKLPAGYRSGVVVESDDHSPFSCRGCAAARNTRDEGARRVEFGSAPERVRLKTNNGPVSVKQAGEVQ